MTRVIVIGAGIVGATIALRFSAIAQVTLVDSGRSETQTSPGSLAWLNASSTGDAEYFQLRSRSLRLWHQLAQTYADCPVEFCGTLIWGDDPTATERHFETLVEWGAPDVALLSEREAQDLCPALRSVHAKAIYAPTEGRCDPKEITGWMAQKAKENVNFISQAVDRIAGDGVVLSNGQILKADKIIVAAGNNTAQLIPDLPLDRSPGIVFKTNALPLMTPPVLATPKLDLWQGCDGRFLVASSLAKTSAKAAAVAEDKATSALQELFGPDIRIESAIQRDRPIPADGFPLVGPVPNRPNLFCAVTHSGMTLAPVIAENFAEMLEGKPWGLDRYALDRSLLEKEKAPL